MLQTPPLSRGGTGHTSHLGLAGTPDQQESLETGAVQKTWAHPFSELWTEEGDVFWPTCLTDLFW